MKYRNFLSFYLVIAILTILFASFFTQTVNAQSCGTGSVRGGPGFKTCNRPSCDEKDPTCICSTSCTGGGVIVERCSCLLYTSDAADERSSVDLGGRRIIKKKTLHMYARTTTR